MEAQEILLKTIEGLNASIASLSTTNKNQSEQIKNLQERIIIPKVFEPAYSFLQIVPNGAARFVTKEIIAKMKNIVIIATRLPFFFSCVMVQKKC